jgi:cobalamin-dependent methionine synthase I
MSHAVSAALPANKSRDELLIIGQDLHIMNPALQRCVEQRDAEALQAMAKRQVKAGAHALDLNLGPAKQHIDQLPWAVETIQGAVDVPLFISSHVLARPEGLHRHRGTATINSVTADPAGLERAMQTAAEHGARLVVLLVRPGLTPFTADERLQIAADVLETARRAGYPVQDLYLDPLFHIRPDPMTWQLSGGLPDIEAVLETLELLPQLSEEKIPTIVALSSASQFLPSNRRPALHRRLLPMLAAAGLDAILLNSRDKTLMQIAADPGLQPEFFTPLSTEQSTASRVVLPW